MKSRSKNGRIVPCLEAAGKSLLPSFAFLQRFLTFSLFTFHFSLFAFAATDWGFNYRAQLLDANGKVYRDADGNVVHAQSVTIDLFEGSGEGGSLRWSHTYDVYCDTNGLFNVFLSDSDTTSVSGGKSLADVVRSTSPGALYIAVWGPDGEMLPRQRICAVPIADYSKTLVAGATTLGDFTVKSNCTVNGTVKANSLGSGARPVSVPQYGIIIWSSDTAPDGKKWNSNGKSQDGRWAKCNGANGTPDLQNRFVCGAIFNPKDNEKDYKLGATGGEDHVTLTEKNLPKHSHSFDYDQDGTEGQFDLHDGTGRAEVSLLSYATISGYSTESKYYKEPGASWGVNTSTASAGEGSKHNNLPTYRALYYIMRIM